MWQFNRGYGNRHHEGWLWVQGYWSLGLVITWRVIKTCVSGDYWWVGDVWTWSWGVWYPEQMASVIADPQNIEPWMVHSDGF